MQMTEKEKFVLERLPIGNNPEIVTNPFSGESVTLNPEAAALYYLILGCQMSNVKYFNLFYTSLAVFKRNWPKEYYILLD